MKSWLLLFRAAVVGFGAALAFAACQSQGGGSDSSPGVRITQQEGTLRVEIGGQLFTVYHFTDVPRPYFYPVLGPDESPMTRKWPLEETTNEEHDHPHHRGLWYAHSSVNGLDFWTETPKSCKIVHDGFLTIQSGQHFGLIKSKDKWVDHNGLVVCTDVRTMRIYNLPGSERMFDFDVTLQAPPGQPVVFGDEKDGAMATRVAETMRLKQKEGPGQGHIVMSTGVRDEDTWGKRADWCDYYGPVSGGTNGAETLGVAIFDHPSNPRHPTNWHVRDYGLFAANPFGVHDFEKKPRGTGDMTIPAGQSVTFRYRFYYHHGDEKEGQVAQQYQVYASEKLPAD
ncbi:MAG TPA: PmoA family protein [Verrucomicrobiae bacterium]|jgi:hypothetical protein